MVVGLVSFGVGSTTILRAVTLVSNKIADINTSKTNLSESVNLHSTDRVGGLVNNLNAFQSNIRSLIVSLASVAERTRNIGFNLAANTTQTSAASEQISRHMDMIHRQAETLTVEVQNVDEARLRINDAATAVSQNIDRQSTALTALSGLIERSADKTRLKTESIAETIGLAQSGIAEIRNVEKNIDEISTEPSALGESLSSIDEISQHIGVLGINASIEAARAGQSGSGFSVVAGEIRKLADAAARNSQEINQRVNSIVAKVRRGIDLSAGTRGSQASLLETISQAVADIQDMSSDMRHLSEEANFMLSAHNDLVKVTIDVTDSTVGMRDSSRAIETSMDILINTARESKRAIEEITIAMHDSANEVVSLRNISAENSENTAMLAAEIAKFRVG